jgi:hypothetical protein
MLRREEGQLAEPASSVTDFRDYETNTWESNQRGGK